MSLNGLKNDSLTAERIEVIHFGLKNKGTVLRVDILAIILSDFQFSETNIFIGLFNWVQNHLVVVLNCGAEVKLQDLDFKHVVKKIVFLLSFVDVLDLVVNQFLHNQVHEIASEDLLVPGITAITRGLPLIQSYIRSFQ